ncbi:hypothetical protein D2S53_01650 [Prevotella intermedia]|nr:hypothetical protein D2S53_01650 [Prevotella intermedia]
MCDEETPTKSLLFCKNNLRKRLFCNAKPTVLPCKTAAFRMQNNWFCNALIVSVLRKSFRLNKSLQFYELVSV